MNVYFVLDLRVFVMIRKMIDVCYFIFEMFEIMENTSDV